MLQSHLLLTILLLSLLCFIFCDCTLSKGDRQKKEKSISGKQASTATSTRSSQELEQDDEGIRDELLEKEQILAEHHNLDSSQRKFQAPVTLAYVTPWNNHGYDVAKWAAKKFTHISPVWFQLKSAVVDEQPSCSFGGTHDIDRRWMDDIRKNNSDAQIVPRFLFEGWLADDLKHFLTDEQTQHRCGRALVEFLTRNQMSGAVMEIWLQIMSMTRGTGVEYGAEIIESWSEEFRKNDLLFILPLSPPLDQDLQEIGIVSAPLIQRLMAAVDLINVMTYDYPSEHITGVAPIHWVEANIRYFLNIAENNGLQPTKLLLGLNWYGYDRTGGGSDAIIGNKFIELLSDPFTSLEFDEEAGENRIKWGRNGIAYFPTVKSIQLRLQLVQRLGIGGIAIWELGQGLDHFTSVL